MESVRIARLTALEFHTRVVVMGVMQMTIMEIVNVSVVSHRSVSALRIVRVSVCGANRTFRAFHT